MSSRRRARWAALTALVAVAAAGTAVAVRSTRRKATPVAPEPPARGGYAAPAAPPVRHNWAGLIAVPGAAVVVLSVALAGTWPAPDRPDRVAPVAQAAPRPAVWPSAVPSRFPEVPRKPPCMDPAQWSPPYPIPSRPGVRVESVRQALDVMPCQAVVLGATATINPLGQPAVEVTAAPAVDPQVQPTVLALPGGRFRESFRLHIRNIGIIPVPMPITFVWAADKRSGWLPAAASTQGYAGLRPDEEADQFVAFDVGANAQLARLRVSLDPGYSLETVDWVLG